MYELIAKESQQRVLHGGLNVGVSSGLSSSRSTKQLQISNKGDRRNDDNRLRSNSLSIHQQLEIDAAATGPASYQPTARSSVQFSYFLFEERERPIDECYDGKDKYNSCYFIFQGGERVMKTRYAEYPVST